MMLLLLSSHTYLELCLQRDVQHFLTKGFGLGKSPLEIRTAHVRNLQLGHCSTRLYISTGAKAMEDKNPVYFALII
ncbi:hypothetical protein BK659_07375 [Pseudomonas brassicacearum]|uniref:Uncharacterized protein n=1 Tax=Pseudomonas brassicacearum TaxID=930166 RepID=A0A423H9E1_9PSED|nr:hypothetical protein BK659_07375 [Pseudomonas brassicacearum]